MAGQFFKSLSFNIPALYSPTGKRQRLFFKTRDHRVRPEPRHLEFDLGDGRVLVLDGDPGPMDDMPVFRAN